MPLTIGLVANVYNEANALPGWLETHTPFFDDIRVLHAGPQGTYSDDGTIEILKAWNIPTEFCAIDEGFGVVRTRALRMMKTDWIMLLDADERFYSTGNILTCDGNSTPQNEADAILQTYDFRDLKSMPSNWENVGKLGANLKVTRLLVHDQGARLRDVLETNLDAGAVAMIRRHWHDFTFRRPTQNWNTDPDWQLRLVRNSERICFESSTRMHEHLVGYLNIIYADQKRGPFVDHFHFAFKRMESVQRAHDVAIYDCIYKGEKPPTREEFLIGRDV